MVHTSLMLFGDNPGFGLWMFLSIGAVSLFVVFIPLVSWIDSRRKDRLQSLLPEEGSHGGGLPQTWRPSKPPLQAP